MNPPTQFGPYLLLERISVGGMAEVYKAKEYGVEGFERTVAVKRILPHVAEDEEFIAMFKDEAKIAVQLNHGNIAQIYNLGNEQDSFYIALEYVNGRDLRAIFQKCQQQGRPMPIAQACYVIMKICEGLDYAHNKKDKYQRELNIVHRDVSPPNILVSFEGEVKLIDFGVAKAAGRASRTQAGILKGKFGYMSPEQVRGMPLDRRSDVFSVGVVLFEMLTGHRLFQADTDFATLEKVRAVEVPRPSSLNPEIPKPLENIIYKALAREPEQRYQSCIELHDELQAFMFAQGLFYSRKDLAAWMRHQYAREIELEKEKDKALSQPPASADRPDGVLPSRPPRKTMMMGPGGPPPPPPPRKNPPPPPGRAAQPSPPDAGAGEGPSRPRKVKRKTMVMTTARPNLPPPPGGKKKPTRPGQGMDDASASEARPHARPKATQSYAASSAPASSDLDWDDDELETRLFEGEGEAAKTAVPPGSVEPVRPARPIAVAQDVGTKTAQEQGQVGGEVAAPREPAPRQPAHGPSVTVVPPSAATVPDMPGMMGGPRHAPPLQPSAPSPSTTIPAPGQYPAAHHPLPAAPAAAAMPPVAAAAGGGPPMGPGGTQAMPALRPIDYDDRPAGKSSAGFIIGMLAAVVVLMGAGFGYLWWKNKQDDASGSGAVADASQGEGGQAAAAAEVATLTVQTSPAKATVSVDGQAAEGESPFVFSKLTPGAHTLRIEREGYLPIERQLDIAAGANSLQFNLQHQDVTLVLETDPPGAAVNLIVEGKASSIGSGGKQYKLTRAAGVAYEIEAVAKGYQPQRMPLEFTGEPTQNVRIVLVPDGRIAQADPTPEPASSGGGSNPQPRKERGTKTTSSSKSGSSGGGSSKGGSSGGGSSGGGSSTPTEPKSLAKTAILRIGTNPGVPPANVFVDGKFAGKTPIASFKVTPGKHKVEFKWDDRPTVKQEITVADGGSAVVKGG